jgi:thiamine biosynthesis protein ThiS
MTLLLNGETRDFEPAELPLETLLQQLDLLGRPVIIEHNRQAVLPHRYPEIILREGDQIEIVRIAAGG